jgi:hypothetical protein
MTPIITGGHISWKLFATKIVAVLCTTVQSDCRPGNVILFYCNSMNVQQLDRAPAIFSHLVVRQFERSRLLKKFFLGLTLTRYASVQGVSGDKPLWAINILIWLVK